jgi:hypothetical protein
LWKEHQIKFVKDPIYQDNINDTGNLLINSIFFSISFSGLRKRAFIFKYSAAAIT